MDTFYRKLWSINDSIRASIREIGDYLQFITPVGFLIYLACWGNHHLAKVFVITYIVTTLIQVFLKALFYNARPSTGETHNFNVSLKDKTKKYKLNTNADFFEVDASTPYVVRFYDGSLGVKTSGKVEVVLEKNTLYLVLGSDFTVLDHTSLDTMYATVEVTVIDTENQDLDVDWSPNDQDSFPSGHTMSAMVGGIFWFEINWWVGIIGLCLGLFCGLSRIIAKAHWVRDVLTSTLIAIVSYLVAVEYFLGGL